MFDKEFFPTPKAIIKKMLDPYKFKRTKAGSGSYRLERYKTYEMTILEPSAGKGDILDYL